MTTLMFREDPYLKEAKATVVGHAPDGGIILDQALFYPAGGGQPGDSGALIWNGGETDIETTTKFQTNQIALIPKDPGQIPPVGTDVQQKLDWARRHKLMRMHTALHLLSVVIPLPVSGGSVGVGKGRLDFDMPEAPEDKTVLQSELNLLVTRDLTVSEDWISDEELRANPGLVKTMSVAPPMGSGKVRLIRIGQGTEQVDLQPCGGTHVSSTREIGALRIGKVEKKGRQNRRVYLHLVD